MLVRASRIASSVASIVLAALVGGSARVAVAPASGPVRVEPRVPVATQDDGAEGMVRVAEDALAECRRLVAAGSRERAVELMEAVLQELTEGGGATSSTELCDRVAEIGVFLDENGGLDGALRAATWVVEQRERLLPPGHVDRSSARTDLGATLYSLGRYAEAKEAQKTDPEGVRRGPW